MVYERLSKKFISHHPCELLTIFQANHQHLFKWIISHHQVNNWPLSKWFMNGYQIVYQPPSMWIINYIPSGSSTSIQVDYQPPSSGLSATIKWIIDLYPNCLWTAIQIVISHHPYELLTTFQADHQHLFKWIISHHQVDNRPLSKRYINGYRNGLSMAIKIVYQP